MKKLLILMGVVSLLFVGCGDAPVKKNLLHLETLQTGVDKLKSYEDSYVISTSINAPDGITNYIESVIGDASYTEYPVDAEGGFGTLAYASQDSIEYAMTDWLTADNRYYVFLGNEDGTDSTYRLPDSYTTDLYSRNVMYADIILRDATDIQVYKTETMNLGYGDEPITLYRIKIPSTTVKHILGIPTYGLYKSLYEKHGIESSVGVLCNYYMQDLDMNLTFSDGNVLLGLDKDGVLQFMSLETGGLGSRLYVTKSVVEDKNPYLRQEPVFTSALDYEVMLQDLADFVASYASYDDAVKALNELNASNQDEGEVVNKEENEESLVNGGNEE